MAIFLEYPGHLAIIKLNDPFYMKTILNAFSIETSSTTINFIQIYLIHQTSTEKKLQQQLNIRKKRATDRRKDNTKVLLKKDENLIHHYSYELHDSTNDEDDDYHHAKKKSYTNGSRINY